MTITNSQSGTNVNEVAEGIYRINTPVPAEGGGFSFNQSLIVDDEPLLFHTGPRKMFSLVHEAVATVLPVVRLRYIALSHVEADECGSLNQWLAAAPQSAPLCGAVAAMVSIGDLADRAPRPLADEERVPLGKHCVRWLDAPHQSRHPQRTRLPRLCATGQCDRNLSPSRCGRLGFPRLGHRRRAKGARTALLTRHRSGQIVGV